MTLITARLTGRGDTEANWTLANPILSAKEIAFSTDVFYGSTNQPKFKVGNGVDAWLDLDYVPIASGSGISSLNGLTGATQTFQTGTVGSDFDISSSGTKHTFNIPDASSTSRGLVNPTDYSLFFDKQAKLVSGTNIKTINGVSVLGAGDIATGTILGSVAATAGLIPFATGTLDTVTTSANFGFATATNVLFVNNGQIRAGNNLSGYAGTLVASNSGGHNIAAINLLTTDSASLNFPSAVDPLIYWGEIRKYGFGASGTFGSTGLAFGSSLLVKAGTAAANSLFLQGGRITYAVAAGATFYGFTMPYTGGMRIGTEPFIGGASLTDIALHLDNGAAATHLKFTNSTTGTTVNDGTDVGITATGVLEIRQRENLGIDFFTNNLNSFSIDKTGSILLKGATSGFIGFKGSANAGSTVYTLPSSDGTSGQFLSTNGSGVLSWATGGGGGGITIGSTTITGGANKQILFNDSGVVGENSDFTFDKTTKILKVQNALISAPNASTLYFGANPTALTTGNNITSCGTGTLAAVTTGTFLTGYGYSAAPLLTTAITAIAFGDVTFFNSTTATRSVAIGFAGQANNNASDTITIGSNVLTAATADSGSFYAGSNCGSGVTTGFWNIGFGSNSFSASGASWGNVVIGVNAGATVGNTFAASRNIAIGYSSDCDSGVGLGIAIGAGAVCKTSNTAVFGGTVSATTLFYFGLGESSATPTDVTLSATNGVGTDIAAANMIISGGRPTGSGIGGKVKFKTATQGATGTTIRSLVDRLEIDENGNLRAFTLHNNATTQGSATQQDVRSGTYTPTLTGVTNVSSSTARKCSWSRVGNVVTVSGQMEVTATANNAQTTIGISLPVTSNFGTAYECGGVGYTMSNSAAGHGAAIYADATNNRAEMDYFETHGGTDIFAFSFTYEII